MAEIDMRRTKRASARELFRRSWTIFGSWIGGTVLGVAGWVLTLAPPSWGLPDFIGAIPPWIWPLLLVILWGTLGFTAFHRTRVGFIDRIKLVEVQMADKAEQSRRRISRRARKAYLDLVRLDEIRERDSDQRLLLADWDPWLQIMDSLEDNARELDKAVEDAEPLEYQRYQALAFELAEAGKRLRLSPRRGDLGQLLSRFSEVLAMEAALDSGLAEAHRRRQSGEAPLERRE